MTEAEYQDRVQWFSNYLSSNASWGVFHASLDDGNLNAIPPVEATALGQDIVDALTWFNTLTPGQRDQLGRDAAATPPFPWTPSESG